MEAACLNLLPPFSHCVQLLLQLCCALWRRRACTAACCVWNVCRRASLFIVSHSAALLYAISPRIAAETGDRFNFRVFLYNAGSAKMPVRGRPAAAALAVASLGLSTPWTEAVKCADDRPLSLFFAGMGDARTPMCNAMQRTVK